MVALLAGAPLRAQSIRDARPGETLPTVASAADPAMSYAVHLPAAYSDARRWPVAFLLDPRGRALIPLERSRAAAERHGYILISSYNTLSDSATDVNVRAMSAMLEDVQRELSVDRRRFYIVGFSGTARMAWEFAAGLNGAVAGLFVSGASGSQFAESTRLGREQLASFEFYGALGETDFNYEEMRLFESWVERNGIPNRMRYVPGGHAWPADTVFDDAFRWFELRAQQRGLAPRDSLIERAFVQDTARAAELERAGSPAEAMVRWREIARDFGDADAGRHADRLAITGEVRRTLALRKDLQRRFVEFNRELQDWIRAVTDAKRAPAGEQGVRRLQIVRRLAEARGGNRELALAAQRELEHAFVMLSFYQPRALLADHRPQHALTLLDVAAAIRPGAVRVALHRAYAYVQQDDVEHALAELRAAVAAGLDARGLPADPSLTPLRTDARFRQLAGE